MKIIQISTCVSGNGEYEPNLYGLGDNGKLYFFGTKIITRPFDPSYAKEDVRNQPQKISGWIEMVDEINS